MAGTRRPATLLDGSSDFVLTYEDKDGDWMLVGDVPWEYVFSHSASHEYFILRTMSFLCILF